MNQNLTVLLDVHLEGMKEFLQDFGWNVNTVTKLFGATTEGRNDDNIMNYTQENEDCVVVSQDKKLIKRLQTQNRKVVGVDMGDLARQVDAALRKNYG